jgi:hypothetical protein
MSVMTALKSGEYTVKVFSWLRRKRSRAVVITRPENNKALSTEWIKVEGTHVGVASGKHRYWLMTTNGVEWWPSEDIKLNVNGKWDSRINVGKTAGPRVSTAVVVRVTPVVHALLAEVRRLRHKANDYAGIAIPQSNRWGWDIMDRVDVQVPPGEVRVNETS